jgi:heat shock protein HtpX
MPAAVVASAGAVGLRAASPEAAQAEPEPGKVERSREVNDLMWRLNKYKTVNCACGTKLKVPPAFKGDSIRCPHCGRINPL